VEDSCEVFPFFMIFYGSALGVAICKCGVDLVCLPLGNTTKTIESPSEIFILYFIDHFAPSE
jgi:hypothetical protein